MNRKIVEGEISWFSDLDLHQIPDPVPKGITTYIRHGQVGLLADGVVGSLSLGGGDVVQILPKIGEMNFLRLLFRAEGRSKPLERTFDEFVSFELTEHETSSTLIARQFFHAIDEILRRSPIAKRRWTLTESQFVRGKLRLIESVINQRMGKQRPVQTSLKAKHFDTAENRVLTEAALRGYHLLSQSSQSAYQAIFEKWISSFPRSRNVRDDLRIIDKQLSYQGYGGSRDYYRKALMLAKVILGASGISPELEQDMLGDSFLVNTAGVFEAYIKAVLVDAYSDRGYLVSKPTSGAQSLYFDGSYRLIPDIIISRHAKTILIADAKYKSPSASDHYQMAVYLDTYGVSRGLLICPGFEGSNLAVKEYARDGGIIVRELYLPMSDLRATESTLESLVEDFSH